MKTLPSKRKLLLFAIVSTFIFLFLSNSVSALVITGWFIIAAVVVALGAATGYGVYLKYAGKAALFLLNLAVDFIIKWLNQLMAPAIRALIHMMEGMISYNPTIFPFNQASSVATTNLIKTMLEILVPLYVLLLLLVGMYIILVSQMPWDRAKAKAAFRKLMMSMFLVSSSPVLFQLLLNISHYLTVETFDAIDPAMEEAMAKGIIVAFLNIWVLGIAIIIMFAAALLVVIRILGIYVLAIFFPIAIFLYFFEFTKGFGANMLRITLLWIFMQLGQAIVFVMTATLAFEQEHELMRGFVVLSGMLGIIGVALMMSGLMKWAGGAIAGVGAAVAGTGRTAGIRMAGATALGAGQVMMGAGPTGLVSTGATAGYMVPGSMKEGVGRGVSQMVRGAARAFSPIKDWRHPIASSRVRHPIKSARKGASAALTAGREVRQAFDRQAMGPLPKSDDILAAGAGGAGAGGAVEKGPPPDKYAGVTEPSQAPSDRYTEIAPSGIPKSKEGSLAGLLYEPMRLSAKYEERGASLLAHAKGDFREGRKLAAGWKFTKGMVSYGMSLFPVISPFWPVREAGRIIGGNIALVMPDWRLIPWYSRKKGVQFIGLRQPFYKVGQVMGLGIGQTTTRTSSRLRLGHHAKAYKKAKKAGNDAKAQRHLDAIRDITHVQMHGTHRDGTPTLGETDLIAAERSLTYLENNYNKEPGDLWGEVTKGLDRSTGGDIGKLGATKEVLDREGVGFSRYFTKEQRDGIKEAEEIEENINKGEPLSDDQRRTLRGVTGAKDDNELDKTLDSITENEFLTEDEKHKRREQKSALMKRIKMEKTGAKDDDELDRTLKGYGHYKEDRGKALNVTQDPQARRRIREITEQAGEENVGRGIAKAHGVTGEREQNEWARKHVDFENGRVGEFVRLTDEEKAAAIAIETVTHPEMGSRERLRLERTASGDYYLPSGHYKWLKEKQGHLGGKASSFEGPRVLRLGGAGVDERYKLANYTDDKGNLLYRGEDEKIYKEEDIRKRASELGGHVGEEEGKVKRIFGAGIAPEEYESVGKDRYRGKDGSEYTKDQIDARTEDLKKAQEGGGFMREEDIQVMQQKGLSPQTINQMATEFAKYRRSRIDAGVSKSAIPNNIRLSYTSTPNPMASYVTDGTLWVNMGSGALGENKWKDLSDDEKIKHIRAHEQSQGRDLWAEGGMDELSKKKRTRMQAYVERKIGKMKPWRETGKLAREGWRERYSKQVGKQVSWKQAGAVYTRIYGEVEERRKRGDSLTDTEVEHYYNLLEGTGTTEGEVRDNYNMQQGVSADRVGELFRVVPHEEGHIALSKGLSVSTRETPDNQARVDAALMRGKYGDLSNHPHFTNLDEVMEKVRPVFKKSRRTKMFEMAKTGARELLPEAQRGDRYRGDFMSEVLATKYGHEKAENQNAFKDTFADRALDVGLKEIETVGQGIGTRKMPKSYASRLAYYKVVANELGLSELEDRIDTVATGMKRSRRRTYDRMVNAGKELWKVEVR